MRIIVLMVWAFVACTSSYPTQEEINTKHVQGMFDAFNRHDWKAMAEYYADSAHFLDPAFGSEYVIQTRKETAGKYADMEHLFPTLHDEVVSMVAQGDKVAVEFISTGSFGDSLSFKLPISCVLTLRDNLIVKDATYYNNCQ